MTGSAPAALWEGRPPEHWQAGWRLPALEIHGRIGSTSDRARALAARGAPAGLLVMAEEQSAGRGRQGRAWHALPGSSLLMSFLLRPRQEPEGAGAEGAALAPGTAPLRVGLAVADAIARTTGVECALKWPNDLVVHGHGKVAGILCEAVTGGQAGGYVVAGIGINVRQRPDDWPPELRDRATSLEACARRTIDRPHLAAAVIDALRPLFRAPLRPLSPAELAEFERRDALRGRTLALESDSSVVACGLDADGALLVEGPDGIRRITTASPRLTGSAPYPA